MRKTFYQKHRKEFDKFSGLLTENPVLERGLVLAPVIVASYSFRNSWILGLSFFLITFTTVFLSSFLSKKIPYGIRVILYALIASGIFIPTAILVERISAESITQLGVFLPLLIINSLIVVKSESRFFKMRRGQMAVQLVCHCIGFFWVILLVGCIREFLGSGTLFGVPVAWMPTIPAALMPFAGFILVGFLAAAAKWITNRLEHPRGKPAQPDTSQGGQFYE